MANPVRQARMPPELDDRLNEWAGERGIRESEAMRRLLERGLDAEQADGEPSPPAYVAEQFVIVLAVSAGVLVPLATVLDGLWPFAYGYLFAGAIALLGALATRGRLPVPTRLRGARE